MAKQIWDIEGRVISKQAVTPSDTVANEFDALWIGQSGNLATISLKDSAAVTCESVPIGWWPETVKKVMSTGTTAAKIVGVHLKV